MYTVERQGKNNIITDLLFCKCRLNRRVNPECKLQMDTRHKENKARQNNSRKKEQKNKLK
jgi:hypothetical protein